MENYAVLLTGEKQRKKRLKFSLTYQNKFGIIQKMSE